MKKMKYIACIIALLTVVTACGKKSVIVSDELAQALNESDIFTEELTELDNASGDERYGVSSKDYTEMKSYVATKGNCDEFVIIKTTDPTAVTGLLNEYKSQKKEEYSDYRPSETSKLDSAFLTEYNGAVVMIVSGNTDKAAAVYEEYLKN